MNRHNKIFKTSSSLSKGKALLNHIIFSPSQTSETVPLRQYNGPTFHCAVFLLYLHNPGRARVSGGLEGHRWLLQPEHEAVRDQKPALNTVLGYISGFFLFDKHKKQQIKSFSPGSNLICRKRIHTQGTVTLTKVLKIARRSTFYTTNISEKGFSYIF